MTPSNAYNAVWPIPLLEPTPYGSQRLAASGVGGMLPAAAVLFLVGRVLFWRSYARGAPARALGFASTFYPSVAMVLLIVGTLILALF